MKYHYEEVWATITVILIALAGFILGLVMGIVWTGDE